MNYREKNQEQSIRAEEVQKPLLPEQPEMVKLYIYTQKEMPLAFCFRLCALAMCKVLLSLFSAYSPAAIVGFRCGAL